MQNGAVSVTNRYRNTGQFKLARPGPGPELLFEHWLLRWTTSRFRCHSVAAVHMACHAMMCDHACVWHCMHMAVH